ncbi:uncharacterized protein LOC134711455 [Mytilus trossulus]|uniref:uncharacterized protein LOC134711455 n=1 Tax=Mytilus trossulus TaxID=6551 RepID=UPI003005E0C7
MELKRMYIVSATSLVLVIAWILIPNKILKSWNDKTRNIIGTQHNVEVLLHVPPTNYLEVIRSDCGLLCNTSRKGSPGPYFDHINADIDCYALFRNAYIDLGHELSHAPKSIPKNLMVEYTMNNRIPVTYWYFDNQYLGKEARLPVWTNKVIEEWIFNAKKGKLGGSYGTGETNALRYALRHAPGIVDGRVMVIGSENPWVEACVLAAGAREVLTLEYGRIASQHPKVKTIVPFEFRMRYLNNTLGKFDAIVTFSSIEHSGLGRYGDALNPWGDIIAIARSWCVTKPGGSLTIGVQYNYDNEILKFNAGRWYGKIRYPYLTTNWKQLYRGNGSQRVHVFTK